MEYTIACSCGNVLTVSEGMAGSSTACGCGRTVPVPSLGQLRREAITPAAPPPAPDSRLTSEPPPEAYPPQEFTAAVPPHGPLDLRDKDFSLALTGADVLAAVAAVLLVPLLGVALAAPTARHGVPEKGPFWPDKAVLVPPPPPPPVWRGA